MSRAPEPPIPPTLIVGAGPVGMVCALCLAQAGVPSVVVERRPHLNPHPKAHEINARTIELLDALGIPVAELRAEAAPEPDASRILFCRTVNEEIGRLDLSAPPIAAKYREHVRVDAPYLNLSQTELERTLRARVESSPHIELHLNTEWEGFTDATRTASRVRDRGAGTTRVLSHRFLVAADGAASPVRAAVSVEMEGPERLRDFASAYLKMDLSAHVRTRAKLYWLFHPAAAGTLIAHHVERRWVYHVPILAHERVEEFTRERMHARLEVALARDVPLDAVQTVSLWRMSAQVARRFRAGPVFLIGDAAHRFPPTGGLGLNTGVADAHNLAWKLAAVLGDAAAPALLDTYEQERRPVAVANTAESQENFERVFDVFVALGLPRDGLELIERTHARLAWLPSGLRDSLMWLLERPAHWLVRRAHRNPRRRAHVQQAIDDQLSHFDRLGLDLGYVYRDGALVPDGPAPVPADPVRDYLPSATPGARLPHVWLDEAGTRSTHDALDPTAFTLLTLDASAWRDATTRLSGERAHGPRLVELEASARARARLRELTGIGDRGALLIRPDGHVAWRQRELPETPYDALAAAWRACHLR